MKAAGDIRIRSARPEDLPAVRALLVETWHDTYDTLIGAKRVTEITNSWHSVEALGRHLASSDVSFLVAEEKAAIVGHAFANGQRPPLLLLSRLYVRPDRQRAGIGTRLLTEVIRRHPKSTKLRLEVEAGNAKGLSFYLREGFQEVSRKDEDGLNHILMEKRLARLRR